MKKFLSILTFFIAINSFAQKEANFWYFGENAGLDFSTNPPTAVTDGQLNTLEGCSSFSDFEGNLLFYSDGIRVFDKNHDLMTYTNGNFADNLNGDPSSTQSGMIIPKPGSTTIYYLFTVDDGPDFNSGDDGKGLNYYTIDISLNNGNGQLIDENNDGIFFTDLSSGLFNSWTEKVAAVRGKECNTYWVVSAEENSFHAFKIDASGVNATPVISQINNTAERRGYLKLSPDGTKLAIANQSSFAILYNFNNENGEVDTSSPSILTDGGFDDGQPYGVEFSIDSQKLYISTVSDFRFNLNDPAVNYKLFQFDLNADNIPDSKTIIHEQIAGSQDYPEGGFRGALQLGPDGKIYATIPLAYQDLDAFANPNGDAPFLDVIENPTEIASEVVFTKNAIDLNGRFATQGLPPFISSLLLPIQITDPDTNTSVNNQGLQLCTGTNKTIVPAEVTGSNITYEWSFDDGIATTVISNTEQLILTNLTIANTGNYSLKIELTDDCGNITEFNGNFDVEVFDAANATEPTDIFFCDTDRDGFNTFNLSSLKDAAILNGLDSDIFEVQYFDDQNNAISGENSISNTNYTNPTLFSSQTIYARVQNKNAPNACFEITDFILEVNDLPIPIQAEPYRICDDLESGSDTDEIINTFILNTKDDEIFGTLDKTQYNLSYHTTQAGAENNDTTTIIDKNTNYTVTTSKTVFVRVENKDNTDCYDANTSLELIVDPLPILKTNPTLEQCIAAGNTNPTVNLTLAESSVSETANVVYEYYEDINGTNLITDSNSHPVQVNTTQSVYVKVITENNCSRDLVELQINIGQTPDNPYDAVQPPVCDDFLDADGNDTAANSDTDNITAFSLDKAAIENGIAPPINTEIFYYESIDDRNNSLNPIDITNFRNDITKNAVINITNGIQFPIYYKILSTINNDCQGLGQFYLQINHVPSANDVSELELCDNLIDGDNANGIVQNFDLDSKTTDILNGQDPALFEVTYHLTADDANTGNQPQASPFTNTIRDLQPIFVRVTNKTTGCFTDHTSFNLIVNPVPIANFVEDIEVCDDNTDGSARNGFSQIIDLASKTAGILGAQDPSTHTVTYHRSFADAQSGDRPLVSPYSNETPNRETIFVRILSTDSQCVNAISNFDVIVNPEPTFVVPTTLAYCDDNLDGDDANGIIQTIDLDSKIPEILGTTQNPNDFTVTFHISQADAASGDGAVASPYQNTTANETFYVRIQNNQTLCVNDDTSLELIINTLPDFEVTTPQILCLNDTPLNISVENARDQYSYLWTDENGTPLNASSVDNIDVVKAGKYTVTATTTNGTLCERSETIEINESNIATLEQSFVTIIDESNNIGSEDNISIFIDTLNNDLGPGDYQFAILNQDDNTRIPIIGFQDEPLFENLEGGIYTIIVNDKNGCSPDTTLEVSVIQFPKFFTPNADGSNDTWIVKGANKTFYPNSSINIFNRYGKIVAQVPIDSQGWNGMYQGKLLPSDDYWFNITLIPPANSNKSVINKKGNFSLLRR